MQRDKGFVPTGLSPIEQFDFSAVEQVVIILQKPIKSLRNPFVSGAVIPDCQHFCNQLDCPRVILFPRSVSRSDKSNRPPVERKESGQ